MDLSAVSSWVWQVLGAASGLALGLGLGAWHLRKSSRRPRRRSGSATQVPERNGQSESFASALHAPSSLLGQASQLPGNSRFPAGSESPQQRLLEHLRQSNLDLGAQLRASAAQHGRLVKDRDEEFAALKDDYDQRVEELRAAHSSELKHLMTLLVEQVDGIHKAHANHIKALEAEMDRIRQAHRRGASVVGEGETTTFAATEAMSDIRRAH